MEAVVKLKETWLSRPRSAWALFVTLAVSLLLFVASSFFFADWYQASVWMAASGKSVFDHGEYWRAWTTLFAHGDFGHLASNAFLFIPLAYALTAYYGGFFFPVVGFLMGGLVNLLVLKTMPPAVQLIGISGLVYWMGSAWLTLYIILERRHSLSRRFGGAILLTMMLFVPETIKPDVSHLSHFLGYMAGIFSGLGYFWIRRKTLRAAEVHIVVWRETFDDWQEPLPQAEGAHGNAGVVNALEMES